MWLSRGSLAEKGLLGYNHWPSQLQGDGSVRLNQLSRLDIAAPYLNCRVKVKFEVKVKVKVKVNVRSRSGSRSSQGQGGQFFIFIF